MNIPQILNESIEVLKEIVDNVEDLAILNALNSKVANLVSLKGCKFTQYSNSSPRTLAYYCMAFMHSGSNKYYVVDCINDYLLPFVPKEKQNRNQRTNHNITYYGETHCLTEWAEILGIKRSVLSSRINTYGWSIEQAFNVKAKEK